MVPLQKNYKVMEAIIEKTKRRVLKPYKKIIIKPFKKRGLIGIFKGKIHYEDAVFNLGL